MEAIRVVSRYFCCLLPLWCGACAITSPQEVNQSYREVLERRREQYEVKPGDVLTIRVHRAQADLASQTLTVLPDGRSDGFFLHNFRFAGKSAVQIEDEARQAYKGEIADESVEISVLVAPAPAALALEVVLTGHFRSPGPIEFREGMTLHDAMALAGRKLITADSDYAILRRPHANKPGFPDRFRIDVNDVSEEILLLPGDEVYLPPNTGAFLVEVFREFIFGVIPSTVYSTALLTAGI